MCTLVIMRNKSTIRFYSCREISKTLQESTLKTVLLAFTCLPRGFSFFGLCIIIIFNFYLLYVFIYKYIYMSNI